MKKCPKCNGDMFLRYGKRRSVIEVLLVYLLTSEKLHLVKDLVASFGFLWIAAELPNPPSLTEIRDVLSNWEREGVVGIGEVTRVLNLERLKNKYPDVGKFTESIFYHALPSPWGRRDRFSEWFSRMQTKLRDEGSNQIPAELRTALQRQITK